MTDMRKNNNLVGVWYSMEMGSFIIHLHRISGGKKYDEEGKEMEKERKWGKKCSWLDLNSALLCCEDSV